MVLERRGLTVKHVLQEVLDAEKPGMKIRMMIRTDSDAARAMLHRVGVGRVRHLATRYLWHQEALKNGSFEVERCASKENAADLGTKPLEAEAASVCMGFLGLGSREMKGFGKDERQMALAALLLWSEAKAAAAVREGSCEKEAVIHEEMNNTTFYTTLLVFVFVVLAVGFAFGRIIGRAETRVTETMEETSTQTGIEELVSRNVGVQGPVTYTRWCSTPRYKPLPEVSWG